jgi:hypothetical protein
MASRIALQRVPLKGKASGAVRGVGSDRGCAAAGRKGHTPQWSVIGGGGSAQRGVERETYPGLGLSRNCRRGTCRADLCNGKGNGNGIRQTATALGRRQRQTATADGRRQTADGNGTRETAVLAARCGANACSEKVTARIPQTQSLLGEDGVRVEATGRAAGELAVEMLACGSQVS